VISWQLRCFVGGRWGFTSLCEVCTMLSEEKGIQHHSKMLNTSNTQMSQFLYEVIGADGALTPSTEIGFRTSMGEIFIIGRYRAELAYLRRSSIRFVNIYMARIYASI
jgi:hypothetical protein